MDKVETIGDAYLVASGLPTVYERHAQEMSLLALELLEFVKHHVIEHLPRQKIQLRIGLHTGASVLRLLPVYFCITGLKVKVKVCVLAIALLTYMSSLKTSSCSALQARKWQLISK